MAREIFAFSSSFNNMQWKLRSVDDEVADSLRLHYDVPDIVARIMAAKGIDELSAQEFLNASFKNNCPNPSLLKDMDKAAARIAEAVEKGEKISQFSDYDADGATSAAQIHLFLSALGVNTEIVIPSRDSGYGPNEPDMQKLIDSGAKVIITTDCGTTADAVLNKVTEQGVDVVVIDHHEPDVLHSPNVFALVNPKRFDEPAKNPFRDMAAAGLAFMFLIALNRTLRERGFYQKNGLQEPNILKLSDIAALGTVCDVMSLTGINRLLVKYGLRVLSARKNTGIRMLAEAAGINSAMSVYHLGFVLGPRINAGGRVGKSDLAVRLLCCTDEALAADIAKEMCYYNDERKQIEEFVLQQAICDIDARENPDDSLVFVYGKDWHSGVIGIVAGRLKERYNVPSIVLSVDEAEGLAHASCRSVHGVDIGAAVVDGVAKGVLVKGGGHTMAAGFTVAVDKLHEAEAFFREHIKSQLAAKGGEIASCLEIDALLDIGALNDSLMDKFSLLEPFGEGNPEPLFALKDVTVRFLDIKGQGHVSCMVYGAYGGAIKAIAFKAADTELGNRIIKSAGESFYFAGYLRQNEWQGRKSLQFVIVDGAIA